MKPSPVTRHPSLAGALALAFWCASATAQVTTDPTRPPPGFDSGMAAADTGEAGGGTMLQSVMISPTQRSAIISGVVVKLGEKYGDAVLVRVAESEVVLKSGGVQQVLKLYPGVEKRVIVPVAQKGAQRRGKTRTSDVPVASGGAQPR
jgi:MSHA biogenesis protein MshK